MAATRLLGRAELGAYALVFSAWMLTSQLPTQMSLTPAEARLVTLGTSQRIGYLLPNLWLALPWALAGALLTVSVGWLMPSDVPAEAGWLLAMTGGLAAFFSPMQEHARRLLHLSSLHGAAAAVSIVRLVVVAAVLALTWGSGVNAAWLPFGALAAGDLLSLAVASVRRREAGSRELRYRARDLAGTGGWLLLGAMVAPAAGFLISFLVTRLSSSAELGIAEAARIGAQPVFVLAVGLSAVLRPEAMEAAVRFDRPRARQLTRQFGLVIAGATVAYLLVTLLPESVNPVHFLVPTAFAVGGLLQLSIVAAAVNGMVFLQRSELTALDRTRSLSFAESWAAGARSALALAAGWLNAWTVPLGLLVGGLIRMKLFSRLLDRDAKR